MHVSGLFLYPVKSLRGFAVPSLTLDALGPIGDRRFLVVDTDNRLLTQRVLPRMTLIEATLDATRLTLTAPGAGRMSTPLSVAAGEAPLRAVTVWKSEGLLAQDCGDDIAVWLTHFLGQTCRLVRIGPEFHRPVLKPAAHPGDVVNFADAVPLLAISEASLADLNDRLVAAGDEPVPMIRFRPTVVIAGAPAFGEDTWPLVRIGSVLLRAAGPCSRCTIPTINPETAERGVEPLRTLAQYRRDSVDPSDVNFGQNLIHETKSGTIKIGDPVVPVEQR